MTKIKFLDHPEFTPNLTPREIFTMGSFGGTYWRPIRSTVTGKNHRNRHKKYKWIAGISNNLLVTPWENYDKKINKYGVKVGTTLEFWESKNWISRQDPYGWVEWYCNFYGGRRSADDKRQIDRWIKTAGPNSRFRRRLINMTNKNNWNDNTISPKIRQTLQHWAYKLTKKDIN